MAMLTVSSAVRLHASLPPLLSSKRRRQSPHLLPRRFKPKEEAIVAISQAKEPIRVEKSMEEGEKKHGETILYSVAPFPLLFVATLPGAEVVRSIFGPFVELVKTWNLPEWLVHWGHPGNMAVVLFAMGGYGTYLGFRIRLSDDVEEKANAKDLHPKLLGGMFFFFALGATGGVTALLTSGKPILERSCDILGAALMQFQALSVFPS